MVTHNAQNHLLADDRDHFPGIKNMVGKEQKLKPNAEIASLCEFWLLYDGENEMASELVERLIAANEGDEQAASGSVFYLAAERMAFLERTIESLCGAGEAGLESLYEWMRENEATIVGQGHVNINNLRIEIQRARLVI